MKDNIGTDEQIEGEIKQIYSTNAGSLDGGNIEQAIILKEMSELAIGSNL